MADIFEKEKRSKIMSAVHSKQNKSTEMKLIKIFKENGIVGWRRNYKVKGHPDFVFPDKKIAIFVDGCFWHGHDCRNVTPSDNADFWNAKRAYNKQHDAVVTETLRNKNWTVIRIWECELKKKNRDKLMEKIDILLEGAKKKGDN